MRWRLILKEFGSNILHISGENNAVADSISRLPIDNKDQSEQITDSQDPSSKTTEKSKFYIFDEEEGKFYAPVALRQRTMEWYHHFLNHPGGERLYNNNNIKVTKFFSYKI